MNLKLACAALLVSATQASNLVELASGVPDLSTLVAAVQAAGLVGALSDPNTNLTVIAPVNSAFEGLPVDRLIKPEWKPQLTDLLLHHVVGSFIDETTLQAGDEFTTLNKENITVSTIDPLVISGATVSFSASVDNGIAYVVDKVLLPTSATNDIVGIAAGNPAFSTLVDLVTKAGLAGALTAEGPLTVFAPTNDAFDNLPNGTLTELAKPENLDKLKDILTYHVASGNAVSSGLTEGQEISMLNGKSLKFMNGMIGSAGLVATDVLASNGK